MDKTERSSLQGAGWRVGDAADFLELSAEEAAFVELKLALADYFATSASDTAGLRLTWPGSWGRASPGSPRWRRRTLPSQWTCS
jgi:hypothetical protein